jgi:hypothetical protein
MMILGKFDASRTTTGLPPRRTMKRRLKPTPLNVRDQCQEALIQIDRYGERLIGCVACNRWGCPGDKNLIMELPEEDKTANVKMTTSSLPPKSEA